MKNYSLPCFNEPIKGLIEKYESGRLTMIYGNAASGKTTSCLLAAIACARNKGKIIFVDTENSFDSDRLKQLYYGDYKEILDNIFLIQPKTFEEQYETILKLKKLCDNERIKLVIVDTIGSMYRKRLSDNPKGINKIMAEQMADLVRIARDLNKIVLITNQVGSKVDGTNDIKMVGGKMMENLSKVIIKLKKDDDKRYAQLMKYKYEDKDKIHPNLNEKKEFKIKEKGLFILE